MISTASVGSGVFSNSTLLIAVGVLRAPFNVGTIWMDPSIAMVSQYAFLRLPVDIY